MLRSCGGCERNLNLIVFPSGRELKSNEQILEFREWQKNNYYFKKQFSILGDSINTLEGYIPIEYNCFYYGNNCSRTGVYKMKDTWWGQVIDYLGGELLVNNSWSGSRVTKLPDSNGLFPSGCSDERIKSLHINNIIPDVIIVCLGVNDFANGVALYFDNFETKLFTGQFFEAFFDAYESMLQNIKCHYPETEIWCCTLSRSFISEKPEFLFPFEYGGQHIESYNAIIKIVAKEFNCKVIDLYDYCIAYDTIDGTHPNKAGMDTIATLVLREVIDDENAGFLSCEENEHRYNTQMAQNMCAESVAISMIVHLYMIIRRIMSQSM